MRPVRRLTAILVGLAALAAACTGNSSGRQAIGGKVTYQGQPLEHGEIVFQSAGNEANLALTGALIKNGAYTIPAEQGLSPGTYRVVISSMKSGWTPEDRAAGRKRTRAVEQLPDKYNTKSELKAEVKTGGKNKLDFDLTN